MPRTMPGKTMGAMRNVRIASRPGRRYRVRASAARVPATVAASVTVTAEPDAQP